MEFPQRIRGGSSRDDDSEDIFNTKVEHLVIMVNGINGSAADWRYAAEQFVKKLPDQVLVHCSACNFARFTFDGVDNMGDRLADEVLLVIKNHNEKRDEEHKLKKISFVAHSLGGLVARYAIGKLFERVPKSEPSGINGNCLKEEKTNNLSQSLKQPCQGKIAGLEPMNFVTIATPHLGLKGHKQIPFYRGLPLLEKIAHLSLGRSGKHLFLTDDEQGTPLLLRMVNDSDDMKFISALRVFKRRVAYANANYDHMAGWRTSSIRRQSELPKSNLLISDEKYPHIVHVERASGDFMRNKLSSEQKFDWEEEMIRGLTQVSWERVDVSFQKSRQRFIAYNSNLEKRYWLNSGGRNVVFHIIDNFLPFATTSNVEGNEQMSTFSDDQRSFFSDDIVD